MTKLFDLGIMPVLCGECHAPLMRGPRGQQVCLGCKVRKLDHENTGLRLKIDEANAKKIIAERGLATVHGHMQSQTDKFSSELQSSLLPNEPKTQSWGMLLRFVRQAVTDNRELAAENAELKNRLVQAVPCAHRAALEHALAVPAGALNDWASLIRRASDAAAIAKDALADGGRYETGAEHARSQCKAELLQVLHPAENRNIAATWSELLSFAQDCRRVVDNGARRQLTHLRESLHDALAFDIPADDQVLMNAVHILMAEAKPKFRKKLAKALGLSAVPPDKQLVKYIKLAMQRNEEQAQCLLNVRAAANGMK